MSLDSVRLSGWDPATQLESVVFAADAPDVTDVVVGGRQVVTGGRPVLLDNLEVALHVAIEAVMS